MQRVVFMLAVGLTSLAVSQTARAAVSISGAYDFASGDSTVPTQANMTYGAFSRAGVNARTPSPAQTFTSGQWSSSTAIDTSQYVQFTLTPSSGYYLSLQSITFHDFSSAPKGPTSGEVQVFLGTGLTLMGTQTFTPVRGSDSTVNFNFTSFNTGNGELVTVRFYGWNSANGGSDNQLSFDNVSFNGSINPVPEPVNVALGIFGGVFLVIVAGRSRPVRDRVQRCWVGVNRWLDAV